MVIEADRRLESDALLVAQAASGDESAYKALYERHHQHLLAVLRASVPLALAEEAAQEAWARAYERINTLDKPQAFFSWLTTIARNYARDHHRTTSPESLSLAGEHDWIPEPSPGPDTVVEQDEDRRLAARALQRLPDKQRAALVLRNLEGRSYLSIAGRLGISVSATETLLHRARSNFQREFTSLQSGSEAPALACYKMRASIRALSTGALSDLRRMRVIAHLESCDPCRSMHEDMRRTRRIAGFFPLFLPVAWLRDKLLHAARSAADAAGKLTATGGAGAGAAPGAIVGALAVATVSTAIILSGVALDWQTPFGSSSNDAGGQRQLAEQTPLLDEPPQANILPVPVPNSDSSGQVPPVSQVSVPGFSPSPPLEHFGPLDDEIVPSDSIQEPPGSQETPPSCATDPALCPPHCEIDPASCPSLPNTPPCVDQDPNTAGCQEEAPCVDQEPNTAGCQEEPPCVDQDPNTEGCQEAPPCVDQDPSVDDCQEEPSDPCEVNPEAQECQPPDPCVVNPQAEECQPPCVDLDPNTEGCQEEPPCVDQDPNEGCQEEPPCVDQDPNTEGCQEEPPCVDQDPNTEGCQEEPPCVDQDPNTEGCQEAPPCVDQDPNTEGCQDAPPCVDQDPNTEGCQTEPPCEDLDPNTEGCQTEHPCAVNPNLCTPDNFCDFYPFICFICDVAPQVCDIACEFAPLFCDIENGCEINPELCPTDELDPCETGPGDENCQSEEVCEENTIAPGCSDGEDCETDPSAPGCQAASPPPSDPCEAEPTGTGCSGGNPCQSNPAAPGCGGSDGGDPCSVNPSVEGCGEDDPCVNNPDVPGCDHDGNNGHGDNSGGWDPSNPGNGNPNNPDDSEANGSANGSDRGNDKGKQNATAQNGNGKKNAHSK